MIRDSGMPPALVQSGYRLRREDAYTVGVVVRNIGGSYELDGAAAQMLHARRLRLLQRGTRIIGRYGRRGTLQGVASALHLSGVVAEGGDVGSIELTFDPAFTRFEGMLTIGTSGVAVCGQRTTRRRTD